MFHATCSSGKNKVSFFKKNLNVAFENFQWQNVKTLLYFMTTDCFFHFRVTARARPCNGVEIQLGNPLDFWLNLSLCTKPRHHSQQICFKKVMCAQAHPRRVGRKDQAGCGLLQSSTAHPISMAMRGLTSWVSPSSPGGCPGVSMGLQQAAAPARSPLSWQKAIPLFCGTEGRMGRCWEG